MAQRTTDLRRFRIVTSDRSAGHAAGGEAQGAPIGGLGASVSETAAFAASMLAGLERMAGDVGLTALAEHLSLARAEAERASATSAPQPYSGPTGGNSATRWPG